MRKAREALQFDPNASVVRSHCHSAFNGPWSGYGQPERAEFLKLAFRLADFAGIEIIAFSVQPSHFDLLVDCPRVVNLTRDGMMQRLEKLMDPVTFGQKKDTLTRNNKEAWGQLSSRFGNVSNFIKQLKQMSARNYHKLRGSRGGLWLDRYDRSFVQVGHASQILNAWYDHSSMRAGLTSTVDEDRFSTFGSAVAGNDRARKMITRLYGTPGESQTWRQVAQAYRQFIASDTPPETARQGKSETPLLTRPEFLMTDVPQIRGGLIFGDKAFADAFFELNRGQFHPNRPRGGHCIHGQNDPDLWTFRQKIDLRKL